MNKQIQRWCDPAMFAAEEQSNDGPKVQLLSCTPDPLGTIASVAHAYQGHFHESLAEITDEDRRYYLADVRKNVLAAPLEFVHFHFRITGVTRGFTHQMVRQRTACYAQESTRFAVKETVPVGLPPSLAGTVPWKSYVKQCVDLLYPHRDVLECSMNWKDGERYAEKHASSEQLWRRSWDNAVEQINLTYNNLVNSGMPAEDARGLLPTNLLTQLNYTTTLRHLIDHAGLRLCTQAQFEWRLVWMKIIEAIREYGKTQIYFVGESPVGWPADQAYEQLGTSAAWQFEELSKIFKPICFKTGKCEFMSDGDRYCSIRDRVEQFHKLGVSSQYWGSGATGVEALGTELKGKLLNIQPIHDHEWLADPKAARR